MIDALRGAALFGILTANMRGFVAPFAVYMEPFKMWTDWANLGVQFAIDVLVSGKFITIFAALFGIGFAIQMDRAERRGQPAAFFVRRMAVLLLIGAFHAFVLWWGDILISYALAGPFLLLLRRKPDRALVRWAAAGYALMPAMMLVGYVASVAGAEMAHPPEATPEQIQETIRTYSQGGVAGIFRERAREWSALNAFLPMFLPRIIAVFLAGVWLWRRGVITDSGRHLDWWRRAQRIGLAAGLPLNLAAVCMHYALRPNIAQPSLAGVSMLVVSSVAVPLLSLFYAATLVLLWNGSGKWRERLEPFSYVGRMALTNYLLQSAICTTLAYSYGVGLYGAVGPALGLIPTAAVYAAQVWFSRRWLAAHRYGPAEWIWRRLTYSAPAPRSAEEPSA